MPRNDISDSLSVRQDDDPRKPLKALQEEAEQELLEAERTDTGGVEHQSARDRAGRSGDDQPPAPGGRAR